MSGGGRHVAFIGESGNLGKKRRNNDKEAGRTSNKHLKRSKTDPIQKTKKDCPPTVSGPERAGRVGKKKSEKSRVKSVESTKRMRMEKQPGRKGNGKKNFRKTSSRKRCRATKGRAP